VDVAFRYTPGAGVAHRDNRTDPPVPSLDGELTAEASGEQEHEDGLGVIVDVVRTASGRGKSGGALSGVHPVRLLAGTLQALRRRRYHRRRYLLAVDTAPYELATPDDLRETVKLVEEKDRRILARQADVRDLAALQALVTDAVSEFGGIDILVASAGIASFGPCWELTEAQWQQMLDINLTGVWKTTKAVIASMLERGQGSSIILTSSVAD